MNQTPTTAEILADTNANRYPYWFTAYCYDRNLYDNPTSREAFERYSAGAVVPIWAV